MKIYFFLLFFFAIIVIAGLKMGSPNTFTVINYLVSDVLQKKDETGTLLLGSSSILRVKPKHLNCENLVNRGINNALVKDLILYASQSYLQNEFDNVILYLGENDIAYGISTSEAIVLTRVLIAKIFKNLKARKIIILPIKHSPKRKRHWEEFTFFNQKIDIIAKQNSRIIFLNKSAENLNSSHFLNDGIHLNEKGYEEFLKQVNNQCKIIQSDYFF